MKRMLTGLCLAVLLAGCAGPTVYRHNPSTPSKPVTVLRMNYQESATHWMQYVVDGNTETCWVVGLGQIPCCSLRKFPPAVPLITWETDASCQKGAPPPAP